MKRFKMLTQSSIPLYIRRYPIALGILALGAISVTQFALPLLQRQAPVIPTLQLARIYLNRRPNDTLGNFYFMLGTQMAARGQILAAENLLLQATRLMPGNADAFLNYGVVIEALDKQDNALKAYNQALSIQEKSSEGVNAQTLYTLGLLEDKMGDTAKGIATLNRALRLEPKNNLIAYDLGVLYAKQEDYVNSALYSEKSLEGADDFAEGHNNYGYALAHMGQFDGALKAVNRSLEIKPDSAAALDSRGFVYYGMGRFQEAVSDYKKALTLDPTIGEIYLHLGEAYEKLSDYPLAIRSYEQYTQLTQKAPNLANIHDRILRLKRQDFAQKSPSKALPATQGLHQQPEDNTSVRSAGVQDKQSLQPE